MRAVVVKLDGTESEVGAEVIIHASAKHPTGAGAAGAAVDAEVRNTQQAMDEKVQLVMPGGKLGAEENVVFAAGDATFALVISAQIGLQSEPVFEIAGKSRFPSAAVRERVPVEKRVADEHVAGRAFMAHVTGTLGPAA